MDYRQLDGTSTTAATDNPMSDQKQEPEAFRRYYDHGLNFTDPSGYYIAYADYEALAKQRDELAAENERQREIARCERLLTRDLKSDLEIVNSRAEKAESKRDELREQYKRVSEIIERLSAERDQALAASAAREIAMRDRAAEECRNRRQGWLRPYILHLPLSPDGQQALDDVRAEEWDFGYQACDRDNHSESITTNPHRKEKGGK